MEEIRKSMHELQRTLQRYFLGFTLTVLVVLLGILGISSRPKATDATKPLPNPGRVCPARNQTSTDTRTTRKPVPAWRRDRWGQSKSTTGSPVANILCDFTLIPPDLLDFTLTASKL